MQCKPASIPAWCNVHQMGKVMCLIWYHQIKRCASNRHYYCSTLIANTCDMTHAGRACNCLQFVPSM